jgi:hypothetical protein
VTAAGVGPPARCTLRLAARLGLVLHRDGATMVLDAATGRLLGSVSADGRRASVGREWVDVDTLAGVLEAFAIHRDGLTPVPVGSFWSTV